MAFTEHIKVALGLESTKFQSGLTKAESKTKSFAKNVKGYLAGALAVGVIVRTTKAIVDFGASIGDLSMRIGTSSEFLQEFQFSATQSGSSAEEASKALEKLSKSIGEAEIGTKLYVDAFDRLGVSLRDADGNLKSTEQVTKEVADGLKNINDPAIKVKTSFDLMGRSGTAMIQVMAGGRKGLEEFGQQARELGMILSNDAVRALQDASGKIEIFERSWKVLLGEVAPSATNFFIGLTAYLKGLKGGFSKLLPAIELFGKSLKMILGNFIEQRIVAVQIKLKELQIAFADFNPFGNADDARVQIEALDNLKKKQTEVNQKITNLMGARDEILRNDIDLQRASVEAGEDFRQVNNLINTALGRNKKMQVEINDETAKNDAILDRVLGKRTEEEIALDRTVQRQQAFNKGGLDALQILDDSFKMQDQVQKLLADGNLTRDEAEKKARQILDAEQQELNLQESIKLEKEKQVALKEKKEDRNKLLADLQKEIDSRKQSIDLQRELSDLNQRIDDARKNGNNIEEERLEQKKIQLQIGKEEFDEAIRLEQQLQKELDQKQKVREFAKMELDAMQARANGFDLIADRLEFQMDLQNEIQDIAERQNLTQEEAIRIAQRKFGIENQIARNRVQDDKQKLINQGVQQFAGMELRDTRDRDERKRIRAGKQIVRIEDEIARLKEKGGRIAEREIANLENRKKQQLDVVLDDKTKNQIQALDQKEEDLKNQFKIQQEELRKQFQEIKDQEQIAKKKEQEQIQKLEDKKQELLEKQTKIAEGVIDAVDEQSKEITRILQDTGDAITNKIGNTNVTVAGDFTNDAKLTLSDFIYDFKTAIDSFKIPKTLDPNLDADGALKIETDGLATETTLSNISRKLDGKLRNE